MQTTGIKKGFTLVELLIVMALIGILTSIAILGIGKIAADTRDQQREAKATVIAEALEKYYAKKGEYPASPSLVGQSPSAVKTKIGIQDYSVLVMPTAPSGTTNSLTTSTASKNQLAYNGTSVEGEGTSQCNSNANGWCSSFNLTWQDERGTTHQIASRH